MHQLFISYSRVDDKDVQKIINRLKEEPELDVWYDGHIVGGEDWQNAIFKKIETCQVFIIALSREAVESEWCRKEVNFALKNKKLVIPLLIRKNTDLPRELQRIQHIDFTAGPNVKNMKKLMEGIRQAQLTMPSDEELHAKQHGFMPNAFLMLKSLVNKVKSVNIKWFGVLTVMTMVVTLCSVITFFPEWVREDIWCRKFGICTPTPPLQTAIFTPTPSLTFAPTQTPDEALTHTPTLAISNTPTETATTAPTLTPTPTTAILEIYYESPDSISVYIVNDAYIGDIRLEAAGDRSYALVDLFPAIDMAQGQALAGECYRLIKAQHMGAFTSRCNSNTLYVRQLAESDVFWFDRVSGERLPFRVTNGSEILGLCTFTTDVCFIPQEN